MAITKLTKKDFQFIEDFGRKNKLLHGKGYYNVMALFLSAIKKGEYFKYLTKDQIEKILKEKIRDAI